MTAPTLQIKFVTIFEDDEDYGATTAPDQVDKSRREKLYSRDYSAIRIFIEGTLAAEFGDFLSKGRPVAEGFVQGFSYLLRQISPETQVDLVYENALQVDPVASSLKYPEEK